jgi:hypothetical protein
MDSKTKKYLNKLDSLYRLFLSTSALYYCNTPDELYEYKKNSSLFKVLQDQTSLLALGKIYIILADKKSRNKDNNNISFSILIKEILDDKESSLSEQHIREIELLQKEIDNLNNNIKNYRDKFYAHIELDKDNNLLPLNSLNITQLNITELFELTKKAYDTLLLALNNADTNGLKEEVEQLSKTLWECYEKAKLVFKVN